MPRNDVLREKLRAIESDPDLSDSTKEMFRHQRADDLADECQKADRAIKFARLICVSLHRIDPMMDLHLEDEALDIFVTARREGAALLKAMEIEIPIAMAHIDGLARCTERIRLLPPSCGESLYAQGNQVESISSITQSLASILSQYRTLLELDEIVHRCR